MVVWRKKGGSFCLSAVESVFVKFARKRARRGWGVVCWVVRGAGCQVLSRFVGELVLSGLGGGFPFLLMLCEGSFFCWTASREVC